MGYPEMQFNLWAVICQTIGSVSKLKTAVILFNALLKVSYSDLY